MSTEEPQYDYIQCCADIIDPLKKTIELHRKRAENSVRDVQRVEDELRRVINERNVSEIENEARWQAAIYNTVRDRCPGLNVDGSGCESGDALDVSIAEVNQGLIHIIDQRDDLNRKLKIAVEALNFIATTDEKDVASCFNRALAIQALQRLK